MASPWPATITQLPALPSRFSMPNNVDRAQFDKGPPQTRLISTAAVEPWDPGAIVLESDAQLATFRTFFETTLSYGALPFETTYFGVTREVRFVEPPTVEELGASRYRLGMNLEVMPA